MKIASYNIRKAIGTDRRRNPERIIDVLNEIDADVIALQEADRRFGVRHAVLPTLLLEAHSRYRAVPLSIDTRSMGWHGNAILVREGVEVTAHDVHHLPCLEPRGAVSADVRAGDVSLRLFGMHLDLSGLWRRRQAGALLAAAAIAREHRPDLPTVFAGDTNEWSAARGCLRDFGRDHVILDTGRSYHARQPIATLDRIIHDGGLRCVDRGVHASPLARRASDHLPIWAVLERAS